MTFHFVKHSALDFANWDHAIAQCFNENPYAYSGWLNLVSPQWGALVNEEYSILIPITLKQRFGITYVSQPLFTQQLGVFSLNPVTADLIKEALLQIAKKYLKIHIQLNTQNFEATLDLKQRLTYCLSLEASYEALSAGFSPHHKRNINKAIELSILENIAIKESVEADLFMANFKQTVGKKDSTLTTTDYAMLYDIISSHHGKMLLCYTISGEILAGLFYLESKTKVVNLFNFITPKGKDKKAMYLILNHWIERYSNQNKTLDFEGSELESIGRFYSGFGASARNYQVFTKNKLW